MVVSLITRIASTLLWIKIRLKMIVNFNLLSAKWTLGHDITCYGLRDYVSEQGLSPWMGISESQIHDLFSRLDCGFFYSALDFGLQIGGNQDKGLIDSNAALEVTMATGWFQFFFWLGLTLANTWLAHRLKVDLIKPLPDLSTMFSK